MTTDTPTALNTRGRLPTIAIKYEYEGKRYTAQLIRHDDGRAARIYLLDSNPAFHTLARLASLLFAHGVPIKEVRRACIGGPLALVLDRIIACS
jgi:hypothetical protein